MSDARVTAPFSKRSIQNVYGLPFTDGNKVTLLWKGKESFQRIFDSMRKARELICLEFYIFRNDDTGIELAEILKEKASEGVNVYVIYDHFGSFGTPMKFWKVSVKIVTSEGPLFLDWKENPVNEETIVDSLISKLKKVIEGVITEYNEESAAIKRPLPLETARSFLQTRLNRKILAFSPPFPAAPSLEIKRSPLSENAIPSG